MRSMSLDGTKRDGRSLLIKLHLILSEDCRYIRLETGGVPLTQVIYSIAVSAPSLPPSPCHLSPKFREAPL